jgi:hypothetical protein
MVRPFILVVCLIMLFGAPRAHSAEKNPVATIHKPVGNVECNADGAWKKAVPAMPLFSENIVRTGVNSFAIIKFLESSILRVQERSEVVIRGTKSSGKEVSKNVNLRQGTVGFNVKKRPNEKFEFSTPTSVASIRGTAGALISDPDSSDLLVLESGIVVLTNSVSNRFVTVNGGQTGLSFSNGQISVRISLPDDVRRMRRVQLLGSADSTGSGGTFGTNPSQPGQKDELRIKLNNPQGAQKTMIIKYE